MYSQILTNLFIAKVKRSLFKSISIIIWSLVVVFESMVWFSLKVVASKLCLYMIIIKDSRNMVLTLAISHVESS